MIGWTNVVVKRRHHLSWHSSHLVNKYMNESDIDFIQIGWSDQHVIGRKDAYWWSKSSWIQSPTSYSIICYWEEVIWTSSKYHPSHWWCMLLTSIFSFDYQGIWWRYYECISSSSFPTSPMYHLNETLVPIQSLLESHIRLFCKESIDWLGVNMLHSIWFIVAKVFEDILYT